jgi:hypothetical protein
MNKNFFKILLFIGIAFASLASCEKEDETDENDTNLAAPEVTFTEGDQSVDFGSDVVISGTVSAPAGLAEIAFFKDDASYGDAITSFDTDTTHQFSVTIPGAQVEASFSFAVQATDDNGQTGESTATITVSEEPEITMTEHQSVNMYAQDAGNKMAFNAETGSAETISDLSADDIDLLLIYHDDDARKHGLYAPSDDFVSTMAAYGVWDWSGTHNATKVSTSTQNFDDATAEDIADMSVSGSSVTVLQVGDVVAFETVDGYKGILNITATALSKEVQSDANITFDAKIVAPASTE